MAETDQSNTPFHQGQGSRPVPDPTILTTQQLTREIAALKELVFTRLDGMDKALVVFTNTLNRVPSDVDRQVGALRELTSETFKVYGGMLAAIDTRFHERDTRFAQAEQNSKDAVAAALQAQKESVAEQNRASETAIAKAEMATMKQIDQIHLLLQASTHSLDGKIADIKDRITSIESVRAGQVAQRGETQGTQIQWVGIMGLVLGAVVGLGGILMAVTSGDTVAPLPERVVIEQAP